MINFEAFQPVALFIAGIGLSQACAVISEGEKVSLARKANRVDGPHHVRMNKLLRSLGTFLRLTIVHFGCFGSVAAITNVVFGVINKRNFKAV